MKEFENTIRKFLKERSWDKLRPADIAKSVSIEAGELLELFQWTSESLESVRKDPKQLEAISKELADVMIYCFDLAVLLGLDVEATLHEKLEKVKQKYPAHLFKNRNENVDAGSEEIYWKIKKEHRMKGE
jgi:NTP pyrophosphatase (non-canonical NTP hydrolase)